MIVSVFGLGKAGLPLAAVIADSGIDVIGVDPDKNKVDEINKGKNPLAEEPGLNELVSKHAGKRLKATDDGVNAAMIANVHIVIVPLFIDKSKKPDFSAIKAALSTIGKSLKKNDLVVIETTVPVGTTEGLARGALEKASGLKAGEDFYLAHSPERIMTGYSISRFKEFPKLVGGINAISTEKAYAAYSRFAKPVRVSNSRTAELAKISEGVYRDCNIAVANELLIASEHYNVDFWEMRGAACHEFCNILEPGNVGGHCIAVYPWFLINEMDLPLIRQARLLNDNMIQHYAQKAEKIARGAHGNKIGIIGLSYREGVKEKAYSRSCDLIKLLKSKGYDVYGYDAMYSRDETEKEFDVKYLDDFRKMDAIVLMNKDREAAKRLLAIRGKVVDIKNIISACK